MNALTNGFTIQRAEGKKELQRIETHPWDGTWKRGYYDFQTGEYVRDSGNHICSNDLIKGYINLGSIVIESNQEIQVMFYDAGRNFIGSSITYVQSITAPEGCVYFTFNSAPNYGPVYRDDIEIKNEDKFQWVESESYLKHSIDDLNLAIGNNNYIGDPVQEIFTVDITGGGILDLSEAITGMPVFKNRPISIECGSKRPRNEWDSVISELRNMYEGRVCKISFDNDPSWYWQGRVHITDFDRKRELGTFNIEMDANAYKRQVADEWEAITSTTENIGTWTFPLDEDYFTGLSFRPSGFHKLAEEGYSESFSYKFGSYFVRVDLFNDSALTQHYGTYYSEPDEYYANKLTTTLQEKYFDEINEEWLWRTLQTQTIDARGEHYTTLPYEESIYDIDTTNDQQRLKIEVEGNNLSRLGTLTVGGRFRPTDTETYGYDKYIGSYEIIFNSEFECKKEKRSL